VALVVLEHDGGGGRQDVRDADSGGCSEQDPLAEHAGNQMSGGQQKPFKGILYGVTAKDLQDAGYIYAPYVPLTQTPVVPPDMEPDPEPAKKKTYRTLDDDWDW
jgi:hypothetical protein